MNKAGEILKPLKGRGGKLTWTGVDQAQRAQATAIGVKNRKPGIEADSRFAGDERVVGKTVVQKRVRHDHGRTSHVVVPRLGVEDVGDREANAQRPTPKLTGSRLRPAIAGLRHDALSPKLPSPH